MTRRQRLEAVIAGDITEELIESCKVELEKLKADAEKSLERARNTDRFKETKALEEKVFILLTNEPQTVEQLRENLDESFTRQRVTALCTNLVKTGKAGVDEVKIKGKGVRKAYYKL